MRKLLFFGILLICLSINVSCEKMIEGGEIIIPLEVIGLSAELVSFDAQNQYWVQTQNLQPGDTISSGRFGLLLQPELRELAAVHTFPSPSLFNILPTAYAANLRFDFQARMTNLQVYSRQTFKGREAGESLNEFFTLSWYSPNVKDDNFLGLHQEINDFIASQPKPKQQMLLSLKDNVQELSRHQFYVLYQDEGNVDGFIANFPEVVLKP